MLWWSTVAPSRASRGPCWSSPAPRRAMEVDDRRPQVPCRSGLVVVDGDVLGPRRGSDVVLALRDYVGFGVRRSRFAARSGRTAWCPSCRASACRTRCSTPWYGTRWFTSSPWSAHRRRSAGGSPGAAGCPPCRHRSRTSTPRPSTARGRDGAAPTTWDDQRRDCWATYVARARHARPGPSGARLRRGEVALDLRIGHIRRTCGGRLRRRGSSGVPSALPGRARRRQPRASSMRAITSASSFTRRP